MDEVIPEAGEVVVPAPPPDVVPPRPGPGNRRVASWLKRGLLLVLVVLVLPTLVAGLMAYRDLRGAETNLLAARHDLAALQPEQARAALGRAGPQLHGAVAWLRSPATAAARLLPVLRGNIGAAVGLARSGSEVVAAGQQSADVLDTLGVRGHQVSTIFQKGTVNLTLLEQAAPAAQAVESRLALAQRYAQASNASFLLPPVQHARQSALADLLIARNDARAARAATELLPAALGANGPRTWLVGAANTAEERGRGGYLGDFATVQADRGAITLGTFQGTGSLPPLVTPPAIPPEYDAHYRQLGGLAAWANLTMSPSFPDGAQLFLSSLQSSGGPAAGGLIELDPTTLAYLMKVTGPVQVAGLPVPITADNVLAWSLNLIYTYDATSTSTRKATLADIAQAVWQKLLAGNVDPVGVARAFGRAIGEGRLFVYSSQPSEEALFNSLGITGSLANRPGDYLLVLNQNLGENKMDYFMQRSVTFQGTVAADGTEKVRLTIHLHSLSPPASELSVDAAGARPDLGLAAATNRSYLAALVPAGAVLNQATIGGKAVDPTNLDNDVELGKHYFATVVDVGPGGSSTVVFTYRVPHVLAGGRYRLTIQSQATVHPDQLAVSVAIPGGLSDPAGPGIQPGGDLVWSGTPLADLQLGQTAELP